MSISTVPELKEREAKECPDAELHTLGECADMGISQLYQFDNPTIVPSNWQPTIAEICGQTEYNYGFNNKFPHIAHMLNSIHEGHRPHIAICGGAAAWALGFIDVAVGDVDIFIHGVSTSPTANIPGCIWDIVADIVNGLCDYYDSVDGKKRYGRGKFIECTTEGLMTIYMTRGNGVESDKVQIILRTNESVAGILHQFDLASCRVSYDGTTTRLSSSAHIAHLYHVNTVDPSRRSTTYERRLAKYYNRGFAIAMENLDITHITPGHRVELPHLTLIPESVVGNLIIGNITTSAGPVSDYGDDTIVSFDSDQKLIDFNRNCKIVAGGEGSYSTRRIYTDSMRKNVSVVKFPPAQYLSGIIARDDYFERLTERSKKCISSDGRINISILSGELGMSEARIVALVTDLTALRVNTPINTRINPSPVIGKLVQGVMVKYDHACKRKLTWWLDGRNPRTNTMVFKPTPESPEEWYGNMHTGEVKASNYGDIAAEFHTRKIGVVYNDTCCICMMPIRRGELNTVILGCGHMFHWDGERCDGFYKWSSTKSSCPECRKVYGTKRNVSSVEIVNNGVETGIFDGDY